MTVHSWISNTDRRFFPQSLPEKKHTCSGDFALNERFSFQVLLRSDEEPLRYKLSAMVEDGWCVRIRRIGYVPVRHANTPFMDNHEDGDYGDGLPGYVPDALFEEDNLLLPCNETHGFWISVAPPVNALAGEYKIQLQLEAEGKKPMKLSYKARLHNVRLKPRVDFNITHWFYADSLVAYYKVKAFSEEFWRICRNYVEDYVGHGLDTLYVPVFTPPLDGVKLPTQLLGVKCEGNGYAFDWSNVKRWLKMARDCGISHFEWVHPFTQWGCAYAIRIYEVEPEQEKLLFPAGTAACSDEYRAFLKQYFTELHSLLKREKLLDKSFFHVSDEPHNEADKANYIQARAMLKEIAPWMKTMDALTDIAYGRDKLTDVPVPSIRTAVGFVNEGIECWCYYCCGPRGAFLNRLLDTPLPKIWMHGILFYRWPFKGFLHWGYNYWFKSQTRNLLDPYAEQDGLAWPGWAYGDTFMVYPGPDGKPVDSIRWEVFSEALQDYQLLQTLNVSRDDAMFRKVKGFDDFPKQSSWRLKLRKKLFGCVDCE